MSIIRIKKEELYERMLRSHIQANIDVYSKAGKAGRWPMPVFRETVEIEVYSTPFIITSFWKMLRQLQNRGYSLKDIGKLYQYPSRLARFPYTFRERALWPLSQEEKEELGYSVAEVLSTMYQKDIFCEKGTNIIYSNKQVNQLLSQAEKYKIQKKNFEGVKSLSGNCWMLAESFHPRYQNMFFEFSGPYKLGTKTVILKEYHNLRPPFISLNFAHQFTNITIVEEYQGHIKCRFDIHNRFESSQENEIKLKNLYVIKDGCYITDKNLPEISNLIQKILAKSISFLQSLDKKGIIIFNCEAEFFCFIEPLAKALKKSWRPPQKFYEKVKNLKTTKLEKEVINWFLKIPKNKKGWYKIFDLRK